MNFKLSSKILKKQKNRLCHSENWIVNGVFAIKKECLSNEMIMINEKIEESTILKILNGIEKEKEFFKTDYIRCNYGKNYFRIFQDKEKNQVFIDEDYVKHFKIDRLFGKERYSPMWIIPEKLLIMPARLLDDHEKLEVKA